MDIDCVYKYERLIIMHMNVDIDMEIQSDCMYAIRTTLSFLWFCIFNFFYVKQVTRYMLLIGIDKDMNVEKEKEIEKEKEKEMEIEINIKS